MRLQDKVAVITGAGSGIGRRTAERFASEGARVVVADVNVSGGDETVAKIRQSGGDAIFVEANVTQSESVKALMDRAASWGGRLNILFNNAGIGPPTDARAVDLPEDEWDRILGVNLRGVYICSKYGIPRIIESGGGSVINSASIAGLRANSTIPSTGYTVSKTWVIGLTRQIAVDYAKFQVRANAICPGPIDTPILDPFMTDAFIKNRFSKGVPLGRMGTPDDIANLVLFLASDESSWMTGSIITIDGGITAGGRPAREQEEG
jgi:NAD(P)-dependent dehydrogenase (short-subunit alcohol dehydrogenase family)